MNNKYFIYALFVTALATWASWSKMVGSSVSTRGGGSSWSSHSGGFGGGGGGHK